MGILGFGLCGDIFCCHPQADIRILMAAEHLVVLLLYYSETLGNYSPFGVFLTCIA
jgi:hypothetical protein